MAKNKKRKYYKQRKEKKPPLKLWEKALHTVISLSGLLLLYLFRVGYIYLIKKLSFTSSEIIAVTFSKWGSVIPFFAWAAALILWIIFISEFYNNSASFIDRFSKSKRKALEMKKERKRKKVREINKKYPENKKWFIGKVSFIVFFVFIWLSAIILPFFTRAEIRRDGSIVKHSILDSVSEYSSKNDISSIYISTKKMESGAKISKPIFYIYIEFKTYDNLFTFSLSNFKNKDDVISLLKQYDNEIFTVDVDAIIKYVDKYEIKDDIVIDTILELADKYKN